MIENNVNDATEKSNHDKATTTKRSKIPEPVKREVLMEAGYRCAVPTCRTILTIDLHHMIPVSKKGGNEAYNLIALCPNCHALFHKGIITEEAIRNWKGMLTALNHAFDLETIDLLLFLSKNEQQIKDLYLSGDGVLKFTRLISAELAGFYSAEADFMRNIFWYKVYLTDKGRIFVESWSKGEISAI
jgi:hypothetical protein